MDSYIECVGAWLQCQTVDRIFKCVVEYAVNPRQATICHIKHGCLNQSTINVFGQNAQIQAFNNVMISTFSMDYLAPVKIVVQTENQNQSNFSGVAVLIHRTWNMNVGHVWGDEIWPMFQMLHYFDASSKSFEIITNGHTGGPEYVYDFVSSKPVKRMDSTRRCFEDIYVGSNMLSYSEGTPHGKMLQDFRGFVLSKMNRSGLDLNSKSRQEPTITFVAKDAKIAVVKSYIQNIKEVMSALEFRFVNSLVRNVTWNGMQLSKQLEIIMSTDILISLPGTDTLNALFLPTHSSLVVPCRIYENAKKKLILQSTSDEVRIFFNVFPHLRIFEICGPNDQTFDGMITTLNVSSVLNYVEIAVDDWKRRHLFL